MYAPNEALTRSAGVPARRVTLEGSRRDARRIARRIGGNGGHMDAQMLPEVLKAAIGPFLGAGLAFLSTRIHDAHRRHQENTAAGNLALTTLNSMLNEHYLWRAGIYGELANPDRSPNTPIWAMLRPAVQTFGEHEVDLKSLAFLFEDPDAIDALNAVRMAQLRFRDMVAMDKFKNDAAVAVLEILSKDEFPSFADAAKAIGPHKIETMITAIRSVVKRARDEEHDYTEAYDKLRAALQKGLSSLWTSAPRFVNRSPVLSHFRMENLPTLPPPVLALMEKHDHQNAAARRAPPAA